MNKHRQIYSYKFYSNQVAHIFVNLGKVSLHGGNARVFN